VLDLRPDSAQGLFRIAYLLSVDRNLRSIMAEADLEKVAVVSDSDLPRPLALDYHEDPMNMPLWKKWTITMLTAIMTAIITFCSSVFSSAAHATAVEFHVSEVVTLLGLSLFVMGFALGPLVWGPVSEKYGRKTPLLTGFFAFAIFQIPLALGRNLATVLISRFFQGAFGAAAMVINSAMFADFWAPTDRGIASSVYAASTFAGPTLGPILGSIIVGSHLGWRWIAWVTLIVAVPMGVVLFLFVPETYVPVLLERKAKKLGLHVKVGKGAADFVQKFLTKPLRMLVTEVMV
jgi:MFS transporter, DHA1 family, multidrug resistance protein